MSKSVSRKTIDKNHLKYIVSILPLFYFQAKAHLFHEGQIPHAGFLLMNGIIKIKKRNKFILDVEEGQLIGLEELMNNRPCKSSAEIMPNTQICIFDRTTINGILQNNEFLNSIILKNNSAVADTKQHPSDFDPTLM